MKIVYMFTAILVLGLVLVLFWPSDTSDSQSATTMIFEATLTESHLYAKHWNGRPEDYDYEWQLCTDSNIANYTAYEVLVQHPDSTKPYAIDKRWIHPNNKCIHWVINRRDLMHHKVWVTVVRKVNNENVLQLVD